MGTWITVPLSGELNKNVEGMTLTANAAESQNAYVTEAKALTRFPQLATFVQLPVNQPVYLFEWRKDIIAVCGGRTYRVNPNGTYADITGATVEGGKRVIFSKTDDELLMAAGKKIVRLAAAQTNVLSAEAPESTHIVWLAGYAIAIEKDSGRFQFASPPYATWDPLNIFSAEGKPDNLTAALVTESQNLLMAGDESIEQFTTSPDGDKPFYRSNLLGTGLFAPYTFLALANRAWGVNSRKEFVGYSSDIGNHQSNQIDKKLQEIDDWTDAFCIDISNSGQNFIMLQIPYATNDYGTKGVSFCYDYDRKRWFELYGFNEQLRLPERWPAWSSLFHGNNIYIGGTGRIYTLGGFGGEMVQKMLWRSGHLQVSGGQRYGIERVRMKVKRGSVAQNAPAPTISMRINKDNRGFGRYLRRDLGKAGNSHMFINFGNIGVANSFQFEIEVTDNVEVDIASIEAFIEPMDE